MTPAVFEKRTVMRALAFCRCGAMVTADAESAGLKVPVRTIPFAWAARPPGGCFPNTSFNASTSCSDVAMIMLPAGLIGLGFRFDQRSVFVATVALHTILIDVKSHSMHPRAFLYDRSVTLIHDRSSRRPAQVCAAGFDLEVRLLFFPRALSFGAP